MAKDSEWRFWRKSHDVDDSDKPRGERIGWRRANADTFSWWEYRFGWVVLVGVIVETCSHFVSKDFEVVVSIVGGAMVAIGIAAELMLGRRASALESEIHEINEDEIAKLQVELTWRSVTPAQVESMKMFLSEIPVDLQCRFLPTQETERYALHLCKALREAGATVDDPSKEQHLASFDGLVLYFGSNQDDGVYLSRVFRAAGIDFRFVDSAEYGVRPMLFVGVKPSRYAFETT